jgi:hypothetical protein
MAPLNTAFELVEVIRAKVPILTGTSILGDPFIPLTMDFSMTNGPPASHNENYVYSWLQDTVEAHQLHLEKSFALLRRTSEEHMRLLFA